MVFFVIVRNHCTLRNDIYTMKENRNFKENKILLAKYQFARDLQDDFDFIEYRKRCNIDFYGTSYGCVTSCDFRYTINQVGISNELTISEYLKNNKI